MKPEGLQEHYYFGGGVAESTVAPLVIGILIIACVLLLFLKRKHMILPFFCVGLLIPITQVIVIFGFHLQIYRVLILIGWTRIVWNGLLTKRDPFPDRMNTLDKIFLSWALCNAAIYTILWHDPGAFANRLGFLYATLGTYFLLRYAIRDREDVVGTIRLLAIITIPIAIGMCIEHATGENPMSFLTGVAQFPEVRNGRIRAQGPFAHSIIAGTFGAMLVPLFVGLWWQGRGNRFLASLGILSGTIIAVSSSSSTPVITYCAGILGLCLWSFRKRMRVIRWGLVLGLIGIQLFMKAPIWFLMNHAGGVLGGTGWHRAELIDQFVGHFGEWWLIGTQNNANWGLDMWDSINAYVNAGVEGGLITFMLFIALMVYAFKRIGAVRILAQGEPRDERLVWAIGVTLFSNTVAFFGIAYFDQSVITWYALLVMISIAIVCVNHDQQSQKEGELTRAYAGPMHTVGSSQAHVNRNPLPSKVLHRPATLRTGRGSISSIEMRKGT